MVGDSLAQVVVETSVDDGFLVSFCRTAECVALARSSFFIHMYLVLYTSEFLELIFRFTLILHVCSREIEPITLANVDLTVTSGLRATNITVQERATISRA